MRDEADESVVAEIFTHREYRAAESIIAKAHTAILDVGAHSGLFTLYARSLNSTVPIVALEPEKNNLEQLVNHLQLNNIAGIQVFKMALAAETGERSLIISQDSHNHALQTLVDDLPIDQDVERVAAISLEDLLNKCQLSYVDLIKMDIEGGEYEVFESLQLETWDKIGALIMEYHNYHNRNYKEIEQRLRANGFGVQIFLSQFDKKMGFLLATNKRIKKLSKYGK